MHNARQMQTCRLLPERAPIVRQLTPNNTAQVPRFSHDAWQNLKLVGVIITAAFLAMFLLWLLFSGDESEKVRVFVGGFVSESMDHARVALSNSVTHQRRHDLALTS